MKGLKKYIGVFLAFVAVIAIFALIVILILKAEKEHQEELHKTTGKAMKSVLDEETEKIKEDGTEILSEKEYNIGDDTFCFIFGEENGDYTLFVVCDINEKNNAFWTHISLNSLFNNENEDVNRIIDKINFNYTISVGDGANIFRGKDYFMIFSNEAEVINAEDYFSPDWIAKNIKDKNNYDEKVMEFFIDFMKNE